MAKQPVQSKGKGKAVEPRFAVNDDVHTVSDSEEVETPYVHLHHWSKPVY